MKKNKSQFYDFVGSLGMVIVVVTGISLMNESLSGTTMIAMYVIGLVIIALALPGIIPFVASLFRVADPIRTLESALGNAVSLIIAMKPTQVKDAEPESVELQKRFQVLYNKVDLLPNLSNEDKADLKGEIAELRQELAREDDANEEYLVRRLRNIRRMSPPILEFTLSTIISPLAGINMIFKNIVEKIGSTKKQG